MYIHDFVSILKLKDRLKLDRRRLEDAHMIYAVLNVMNYYPDAFTKDDKSFRPAHFNKVLCAISPKFYKCFSDMYSGWYVNINTNFIVTRVNAKSRVIIM